MTINWKMNCFFCVWLCSLCVCVIGVIATSEYIYCVFGIFSSKIVLAFFCVKIWRRKKHTFIFWHSFEQVTSPPRPMVFNSPPRSPLHSNPPKWLPAVPSARLLLPICFYVQRQHLKSLNILISIVLSILLCTHPFCCIAFIFCNETMV